MSDTRIDPEALLGIVLVSKSAALNFGVVERAVCGQRLKAERVRGRADGDGAVGRLQEPQKLQALRVQGSAPGVTAVVAAAPQSDPPRADNLRSR